MGDRANAIIPTHFENISKVHLPEILCAINVSTQAYWRPCPPFDSAQDEFEKDGYTMFLVNDPLVVSLRVCRSGLHIHSSERWSGWSEEPARLLSFVRASNHCAKFLGADWYLLHADDDVLQEKILSLSEVAAIQEYVTARQIPKVSIGDLTAGLDRKTRCVSVRTDRGSN